MTETEGPYTVCPGCGFKKVINIYGQCPTCAAKKSWLEAFELLYKRRIYQGGCINFNGYRIESCANLAGANLAGANLAGANLAGANLIGANLISANLAGADLSKTYLSCDFSNGTSLNWEDDLPRGHGQVIWHGDNRNWKGGSVAGRALSQWNGKVWEFVDTRNCLNYEVPQIANIFQANLSGANLRGAHLVGVNLSESSLDNANLSKANLRGANLRGANLRGALFTGATMPDGKIHS